MSTRNFEEYRAEVLEQLGATTEDLRNEPSWRAKVLEALGAEYTDEDTRNFERYRLKVLENLSGGGGGGSSDFSTAKVTVVNNTGYEAAQGLLMTIIDEGTSMLIVNGLPSGTFTVPLYKGVLYTAYVSGRTATVSGNVEYDDGDLTITGDCTITIS